MHALLTGGSGFVGGFLARALLARGETLVNLDLHADDDERFVRVVRGDIRDNAALDLALPGCDRVYHLAAAHHDQGISRDTFMSVNEDGARLLLEACDRAGVREVVFISSVAVYGSGRGRHLEHDETLPESDYGASKLAAERVFSSWVKKGDGRRALALRPAVVFGPENFANMFTLIRQIDSRRFLQVGEGTNVKSMVFVENLIAAMLHLQSVPGRSAWDVYNIVDQPDMTSAQITDAVRHALGRGASRVRVPLTVATTLALPFDVLGKLTGINFPVTAKRIRKLASATTQFPADKLLATGFRNPVALRDGIERMVAWYLREGRHRKPVRRLPPAIAATPARVVRANESAFDHAFAGNS